MLVILAISNIFLYVKSNSLKMSNFLPNSRINQPNVTIPIDESMFDQVSELFLGNTVRSEA